MSVNIDQLRYVDYAAIGVTFIGLIVAFVAGLYAIPWKKRRKGQAYELKNLNSLWPGRVALESLLAAWIFFQLLRLSTLWGTGSVVFPTSFTNWTGDGWMCRIYLTLSLGILQPLCSLSTLLLFSAATSPKRPKFNPNDSLPTSNPTSPPPPIAGMRELWAVALATAVFGIALIQAVIAWISVPMESLGLEVETDPRSALGIFFGTYWEGEGEDECGTRTTDPSYCTLCTFPAAAVLANFSWTCGYLLILWSTCSKITSTVVNRRLKHRIKTFAWIVGILSALGSSILALTVATGPFSWVNQTGWLVYFSTVWGNVLVVSWELVIRPVYGMKQVEKALKEADQQQQQQHKEKKKNNNNNDDDDDDENTPTSSQIQKKKELGEYSSVLTDSSSLIKASSRVMVQPIVIEEQLHSSDDDLSNTL